MNSRDWDAFGSAFTDDVVEEYPQSGEVIRGLANIIAVRMNYPGGVVGGAIDKASARVPGGGQWVVTPRFTLVRVETGSDATTAIFRSRYPDGSTWWLTAMYELRCDKI